MRNGIEQPPPPVHVFQKANSFSDGEQMRDRVLMRMRTSTMKSGKEVMRSLLNWLKIHIGHTVREI